MKFTEIVGMISTGALLTLGAIQLLDWVDRQDGMSAAQAVAAPQVSRAPSVVTGVGTMGTVAQINRIVALSQEPLSRSNDLTPVQKEAIAFFESTARRQNEQTTGSGGSRSASGLRFSNMAVDRLTVRYFYRLDTPFAQLDRQRLLRDQASLVRANLCGSEATLSLMRDYGFNYEYTFLTADGRYAGAVQADASTCT